MSEPTIREMLLSDASVVVALNAAVVDVTSPMDAGKFASLFELCSVRLVVELHGVVEAFVMVVPDDCRYDNENFRWFKDRTDSFFYIDRIVVSTACQGLGVGRWLYSQIFAAALQCAAGNVCAEMDLDPPNQQSLRFHRNAGFVPMGTRLLNSGKRVSMQMRQLTDG